MSTGNRPDLSKLQRSAPDVIPMPRRSWRTRIALPGIVVLAFAALLLWSGRDALRPRLEVKTISVVVRTSAGASGAGGGGTTVARAAGWIEPDPYPVSVTALSEGVVADVLVLEGDRVEKDQVVV